MRSAKLSHLLEELEILSQPHFFVTNLDSDEIEFVRKEEVKEIGFEDRIT